MNTHELPAKKKFVLTGMPLGFLLAALGLLVFAFLDLVSYEYYDSLSAFVQPWTNNATYLLILAAAIFAGVMGLLLTYQFQRAEPPRQIWLFFSLGYVSWILSEISGFVNRAIYEETPTLTFSTIFWVGGYICFAIALFLQYRLVYRQERRIGWHHFGMIMAAILGLSALVAYLALQGGYESTEGWLAIYVSIFYPVSDIVLGLAAIWLTLLFSRGNWGRPWWGLIAFFFADGIYTWYNLGGDRFLTPLTDTWLSVLTDLFYIGGYLIVGLACLSLFLKQRQQMPLFQETSQTAAPPSPLSSRRRKIILWGAVGICLILMGVFAWIYHFQPLGDPFWNETTTSLILLLAATSSAVCGTLLALQFNKGEPPRRIWLTFTLGWWAWMLGEVSDLIYSYFYEHYPEFTVSDVCWILGYLCFGLSIYYQFRLLARLNGKRSPIPYLAILFAILLVTTGFTQAAIQQGLGKEWSWLGVYLAIFYPVCDLLQGAAALWFSLIFRGSRLGRPWWALICFAVADSITTWLWIGGGASLAEQSINGLYLFSDTVYLGGYFLAAVAFLSLYLLQRNSPLPTNSA